MKDPFPRPAPPALDHPIKCPFKVGDRIHELRFNTIRRIWEKDDFRPDATVDALTSAGFDYSYDYEIPIGRAQWGMMCGGGTCYPEGFRFWTLI